MSLVEKQYTTHCKSELSKKQNRSKANVVETLILKEYEKEFIKLADENDIEKFKNNHEIIEEETDDE